MSLKKTLSATPSVSSRRPAPKPSRSRVAPAAQLSSIASPAPKSPSSPTSASRRSRSIAWAATASRAGPSPPPSSSAPTPPRSQAAGAVAIVLEGLPRELASILTGELSIPTIGIGAGPDCDGQILVFHDLFHLTFSPPAKFVRRYGDAAELFRQGIERYREDVATHAFPDDSESYHLPAATREEMSIAAHLQTREI